MADEAVEPIETPDNCDFPGEYNSQIEDDVDLETETDITSESEAEAEAEQEDVYSSKHGAEVEQQFARYERNYRARRIRELTLAPIKKRRDSRARVEV